MEEESFADHEILEMSHAFPWPILKEITMLVPDYFYHDPFDSPANARHLSKTMSQLKHVVEKRGEECLLIAKQTINTQGNGIIAQNNAINKILSLEDDALEKKLSKLGPGSPCGHFARQNSKNNSDTMKICQQICLAEKLT